MVPSCIGELDKLLLLAVLVALECMHNFALQMHFMLIKGAFNTELASAFLKLEDFPHHQSLALDSSSCLSLYLIDDPIVSLGSKGM